MRFVGVDLAWSTKNPSGVAALSYENGKLSLVFAKTVLTDDEMAQAVRDGADGRSCFVAVDAPLVVPNETGRRRAEKLCGEMFRKYHAGAHPSNRQRLSQWTGSVRGEDVVTLLAAQGFAHRVDFGAQEEDSVVFEVYPHPSMVVLFGLDRVIPYKAKPKRTYEDLWRAFGVYQRHLRDLKGAQLPLELPESIIERDVTGLKGKALKEFEDTLDAIFCAYLAAYAWKFPDRCRVLGSLKEGYILTPVFPESQTKLTSVME